MCSSATDQVASFAHLLVDFQNFDVECSINCLTRRNKFFVNNSLLNWTLVDQNVRHHQSKFCLP